MDSKPSGLPSSSGAKNKGVAIVGADPWSSSDDSSDGSMGSESERTVTADFGAFLNPESDGQEVDSRLANHLEADSETESDRTEGARFGQITNNVGNSSHFSAVGSGSRPAKRLKSPSCQVDQRILREDADSGNKQHVKRNMAIPESWKVHPRKDEVDPDGWEYEVRLRNDKKTKDKYYYHKDYNYAFRSKPEVQFFLDTGKVIVNKVPRILQKKSAGPSVRRRGSGRPRTTRKMTLNSGSGTSASGGKAPASTKLPHGFV